MGVENVSFLQNKLIMKNIQVFHFTIYFSPHKMHFTRRPHRQIKLWKKESLS